MKRIVNILVICAHADITATILRLLTTVNDWNAISTNSLKNARPLIDTQVFDVILLGNGLSESDEQEISSYAKRRNGGVKVIQHFGGGSGLLFGEIHEALAQK